jgi:ribosome assembly protein 4
MSQISLVQFEDENGNRLSEVLQVPNEIELDQLKSLINTQQDLFINGNLIVNSLQNALLTSQLENVEEIKKIRLCQDLPSAKPAFYCSSVYSGHEGPVLVTMFTKDILVTAGGDKTVRFWDLITKTQFKVVQKHTHWVLCLDHNDDYVVSGGMDGLINIYDHKGNHIRTLSRHKDGISILKISNNRIISCSRDCTCIIWNFEGEILSTWNHSKPIKSLCVTGDLIMTGGTDNSIRIYKDLKYVCNLSGHASQVNCIQASGKYIISGDDNGQIIIWKDLQLFRRLSHKKEVISLSFNPNGMSFASASFDKTVKLWNIETGENMCTYFHVNLVYKVKVYNDMIISCSKDKTVKIFKISKKKVVSDLVCDDEVYDFDYSNNHLVCGSRNNKVYFFN